MFPMRGGERRSATRSAIVSHSGPRTPPWFFPLPKASPEGTRRVRVLLVNTNRQLTPYPAVPIGLCSVATHISALGHEVQLVDLCFEKNVERALSRAIGRLRPEVVGLGVRNLDNCDALSTRFYLPEVREVVRYLHSITDVPIVAGGGALGVGLDEAFRFLEVDYGVFGDGELSAALLLEALSGERELMEVPGLIMRNGEEVKQNPQTWAFKVEDMLHPCPGRWLDLGRYIRWGASVPLQTKRGCAFECIYCTYGSLEGPGYRLRSPQAVADEAAELVSQGAGEIEFTDATFNHPPEHAFSLCQELAKRNFPLRFSSTGINPAAYAEGLFEAMAEAGFGSLTITLESASPQVLACYRKGFDGEAISRVAQGAIRAGLPTLWVFLMGGPGEDEGSLIETLRFIDAHHRDPNIFFISFGVRIYPRTGLVPLAERQGLLRGRENLLEPTFYFSPELDRAWAAERLNAFARRHPRVILSSQAQGSLLPLLQRLLSFLRVRSPLWRLAPLLNRLPGRKLPF